MFKRILIAAIALILLPGCLTNYVLESGERSQTVELREAAISQQRIVLAYNLVRGERIRISRCVEWDRKTLATNRSRRSVWGQLAPQSTLKTKDLVAIPLSTDLSKSETLLRSNPAVMMVKENFDLGVDLKLLSGNGEATNQAVLFLHEGKTYEAWWTVPLLPFTAAVDVATCPVQVAVILVAFNWN